MNEAKLKKKKNHEMVLKELDIENDLLKKLDVALGKIKPSS